MIAYVAAWVAALFATDPSCKFLPLIYMFPLGLAGVFKREYAHAGPWTVMGVCVGVYLVHAWFFFRSRTKLSTLLLFLVLIILFIGNVSGCREMIHAH